MHVDQHRTVEMIEAVKLALEELRAGRPAGAISLMRLAQHLATKVALSDAEIAARCGAVLSASPENLQRAGTDLLASLRASLASWVARPGVLVVAGDDALAQGLRTALLAVFDEVRVARSAADARAAVADRSPGVVVIDLMLPDEDGRELLAEWSDSPDTGHTPIVVLSAAMSASILAECIALGAREMLDRSAPPSAIAECAASFRRWSPETGGTIREVVLQAQIGDGSWGFVVVRNAESDPDGFQKAHERLAQVLPTEARLYRWSDGGIAAVVPGVEEEVLRAWLLAFVGKQAAHGLVWVAGGAIARTQAPEEVFRVAQRMALLADSAGEAVVVTTLHSDLRARVLIAEDDEEVARLLKTLLIGMNMYVRHVKDGHEALAAAEQEEYGLVILDVRMPGMDGLEVLRALRRRPRHERTPIVLCTSLGGEGTIAAAFEAGVDDYIVKPFGARLFQARISALLARR